MVVRHQITQELDRYRRAPGCSPLYVAGDALDVLRSLPADMFDCCITSPPYWGKREYGDGGIGLESRHSDFVDRLCAVCAEVKRVLKPTGSFWLNIGDTYHRKSLVGIPWRVALHMIDVQGWTLRNSVIWNKIKGGPDNTRDRLRNVHEDVFHFVKLLKGYYYDADAVRSRPKRTKVVNGAVVTASGVRGWAQVRWHRSL